MRDLTRRILTSGGEEVWKAFESASSQDRSEVIVELKAEVDRLVRIEPLRALPPSEALLRASRDTPPGLRAVAVRGRAVALHANGRSREALTEYVKAVRLYEADGDAFEAARVARSLVDVYQTLGEVDEALRAAERARSAFQDAGDERQLAQLEVNVGNVHLRRGRHSESMREYSRARDRFQALGDELGGAFASFGLGNVQTAAGEIDAAERSFREARATWSNRGMALHVADCDYSLAYLESRRGSLAEAIRGLERARQTYRQTTKPAGVPHCDLDLAEIFLRIGSRRDALEHANRAGQAFRELGLHYELAKALSIAGSASLRLGDRASADRSFSRAEELFSRTGNRVYAAALRIQRFSAALQSGSALPVRILRSTYEQLRAGGHRLLADIGAVVLARALLEERAVDEAKAVLEPLLGRPAGALEDLVQAEVLEVLSQASNLEGDRSGALRTLEAAVQCADRCWTSIPGTDARIAFFRGVQPMYADLSHSLARETSPDSRRRALLVLESGRHRGTLRPAYETTEELARLRGRLGLLLGRKLESELQGPRSVLAEDLEDELRAVQTRLLALTRDRSGGQLSTPITPEEIRRIERGPDLVLVFVASRHGFAVWTLGGGHRSFRELDLTSDELIALRNRLTMHVTKARLGREYYSRHGAALRRSANGVLEELGRRLLGPVRNELARARITVVPYGPLHGLPFHAFRIDGRHLVEDHECGYAHTLRAALPRESELHGALGILGEPEPSLPYLREEVETIEALFRPSARRLEAETWLESLTARGSGFSALHVAAHGAFEAERAIFSGMKVGNRVLTGFDLRSTRLPLDLVVLSGCETGRYQCLDGEELLGLDRAFLAAGARSVVSSGWPVEDEESFAFVRLLYEGLAAGRSAGAAHARAQRARLAEGAPLGAWAAFALWGDPSTRLDASGGSLQRAGHE